MWKIMPMEIRRAVPDDVPDIIRIGEETWPIAYAFAGADYIAAGLAQWWSVPAIQASLADTTTLVAVSDETVDGIGNIDLRGEIPVIWKLYVSPRAQSSGIGSALLRELIAVADGGPVRLEYLDGNARAAAFYARHGFTEIGREGSSVWMERTS
jgi:ribosomal protein S18 acetylase RimI-like enzyme